MRSARSSLSSGTITSPAPHSKVGDAGLMRRQNDTFRKHARGKFASLLMASVKEPAVLIYLDAPANHKKHANENLAAS